MAEKGINNDLVKKFFEDYKVKFADRKMFHALLVRKFNDTVKQEYVTTFTTQQFNKRGFDKVKKGFGQFGYSKVIVLHNPNELNEENPVVLSSFEKNQIQKDDAVVLLAKKQAEEIADLKKQLEEKAIAEKTETTTTKNDDDFDVETANDESLIAYAKANTINLGNAKKTDVIREIIKNWIKDQSKK